MSVPGAARWSRTAREQRRNLLADFAAAVSMEDVVRRGAEELLGTGRANQAKRCRINEHEPLVLDDEDSVRRQFHQSSIAIVGVGHLK